MRLLNQAQPFLCILLVVLFIASWFYQHSVNQHQQRLINQLVNQQIQTDAKLQEKIERDEQVYRVFAQVLLAILRTLEPEGLKYRQYE